ncbi:hypothetical protein [Streptomyces sp. NPDC086782]
MTRHPLDERTESQRLADEFDALFRASVQRAEEKREARVYPYDLEVRV